MPTSTPSLLRAAGALAAALTTSSTAISTPAPTISFTLAGTWLQTAGSALLATLPQFLRPYLPRILRAVLVVPNLGAPKEEMLPTQSEAFLQVLHTHPYLMRT